MQFIFGRKNFFLKYLMFFEKVFFGGDKLAEMFALLKTDDV